MFQYTYLMYCPLKYPCFKNIIELREISLYVWLGISFYGFLLHLKPWNIVLGLEVEELADHSFNCVHYLLLEIFIFHILFNGLLNIFPVFSFNV